MATAAASQVATPPAELPVLPDELLEDIFLRLDDAADLARASAACTSFNRIVSARGFLRRFRSLHTPPVLGFLESNGSEGLHHAVPPHRSAAAARALAQAADFTFSFLPKDPSNRWHVIDARDGRVLLSRLTSATFGSTFRFRELVVCDPLYRRYVQIPPIPDDTVASALCSREIEFKPFPTFEAFLAPAGEGEANKDELSFQVICNVLDDEKVATFVFSSVTGQWLGATSFSFFPYGCIKHPKNLVRYNIRCCFYWRHPSWNNLLVLDICDMKFCVVEARPDSLHRHWAIVDAGEDRLGLIAVDVQTLHLYYKTSRNIDGVGADVWRHEKIIPLPEQDCYWTIVGTAGGCFLLLAIPQRRQQDFAMLPREPNAQYFTLDLKTSLVERLCVLFRSNARTRLYGSIRRSSARTCLYSSFPPSMSLPSI